MPTEFARRAAEAIEDLGSVWTVNVLAEIIDRLAVEPSQQAVRVTDEMAKQLVEMGEEIRKAPRLDALFAAERRAGAQDMRERAARECERLADQCSDHEDYSGESTLHGAAECIHGLPLDAEEPTDAD